MRRCGHSTGIDADCGDARKNRRARLRLVLAVYLLFVWHDPDAASGAADSSRLANAGRAASTVGEAPTPPVDGIRDNSFLIEEAYNQEMGVVQHIFTSLFGLRQQGSADERSWDLSFTQEWPVFSQAHQLSYTVPYAFLDDEGEHGSGLGDMLLNYRYQLTMEAGAWPAISPRFSLIFPSGDDDRGFGNGVLGYQFNFPLSKTLTDRLYANLNAGLTFLPGTQFELSDGRRSEEKDLLHFSVGGSLIYAVTETLNLMIEAVGNFDQELKESATPSGRGLRLDRRRGSDVVVSPGVRWAMNLPDDLQMVYGVAVPIGVTDEAIDYGVFLYLSIEHPFHRGKTE